MRKLFSPLIGPVIAGALVAGAVATSALAQSRGDQASAREEMRAGRTMSSREIERRVVPQMRGNDYLGFEYDGAATAYRLKFMKEGQVTWVDVDARTGKVMRIAR